MSIFAWRMEKPSVFGVFHIAVFVIVVSSAVILASIYARHFQSRVIRTLSFTGWFLIALEVFKQLFIYEIVNGGAYDWWFFPFQLCSVPMYLCVLLPFIKNNTVRSSFLTFMATYTFVSSVAALVFPEDFMRSFVVLTLHGFIWHGALLFISLLILFSRAADLTGRGFFRATLLFLLLCVIAVSINALTEPVVSGAAAFNNSFAFMFYMNPYHLSPQPIVSTVQKSAGIGIGLALYAIVIIAVSGSFCLLFRKMSQRDGSF